ncbi:MAG: response regulator [Planctomycetia bacterium]|nr:response regulator [Planctomycetia bacterium]
MIRCLIVFCIAALFLLPGNRGIASDIPLKNVRVGFFQFDGYHMRDHRQKNGKFHQSGYGYDILQMLRPYTNWDYEYIGYEKGWSAMLPMLESGEIDILTSAVKIPEKERKFDFSHRAIGYSAVIMTVKAGCTEFLPRDYSHWNGIKVGVIRGNSKNKTFAKFAEEKKFTYQTVEFTQIDEMHATLQNGKIDAIVTGSLRRLNNEWLYEELDVRPFYIIVKKGNQQLLREINAALEKLEMNYPGYANELQIKYYDHASAGGEEISFSLEERAYRNQCKNDKRKFRVLVNPDRFPFSYFKNGKFTGIMKNLLDTIKARSDLDLEPVFCKDRNEYLERFHRRDCDLILDMRFDYSLAEQQGYILTPTYLPAMISRISRKGFFGKINSFAVVKDSNMANLVLETLPKECEIRNYPSIQAVIDAVKTGRENTGFVFTQTAEGAVLNDHSGILTHHPTGLTVHFAIGIKKEQDRSLVGILSKTVRSLSENEVQKALTASDLRRRRNPTFRDFVTEYPMIVSYSLAALIFVLGSTLIIVRIYQRRAGKAAFALEKNSRMWKLLVNSLPIHIFAKEGENNFRFTFNNRARAKFFGLKPDQMENTTDYDYMSAEEAEKRREIARKLCLEGTGQDESILEVKDQNGRSHLLYSLQVPFTESDGTKLILGCSIDQTELREALELAQQASAAKGIFLSQMSHEIRTPLNAIIGYLNIARESGEDQNKIMECMKKGLNASTHLLSIINDILDVSSIESGKIKIAREDFDFKHLLTGIVSMFCNQAESRKIHFELILSELTEEWLVGDSLRVNQILLNLLSNAMKFTQSGGSVTLTVKQLGIIQNRVQLMLQVADTGCGMPEEFLERIFKPFEQQNASTAREYGGTGLGLSIAKNLISLMGGTIEITSKVNEGTTFTVNLSFEKSSKTLAVADVDFSRLRALVADDQKEDREYIKMVLAKCGVKCDIVESGEAAVHQLERRLDSRHPYDLCLLDLRLSGISGVEAARQMRQLENNTDLPIILLTAYDAASISPEAHAAGVNKIFQKPLFHSTFFDFLMSSYYHSEEKKSDQEAKEALKGLRILLVEDNQMNMDISTQYLERGGMQITPAWNGKEAVDIFTGSAPGTFQAVLMDIQMPIMDGYTAAEQIRSSTHPEAKSVPIIAMTANAFNEDVVKALKSGMNDHISKPVFYDRLFQALSKLTQKEN